MLQQFIILARIKIVIISTKNVVTFLVTKIMKIKSKSRKNIYKIIFIEY